MRKQALLRGQGAWAWPHSMAAIVQSYRRGELEDCSLESGILVLGTGRGYVQFYWQIWQLGRAVTTEVSPVTGL